MGKLSRLVQRFINGNVEYYGSRMTNDCEAFPFITITGQTSNSVFIDSSAYYVSLARFRNGEVNIINIIPYPEKFNGIEEYDFSAYSDAVLIFTNSFLQKWYLPVIGRDLVCQKPIEYPVITFGSQHKNQNVQKCAKLDCKFAVHANIKNNGGNYCCYACKHNKNHGPACKRKGLK